MYLHMQADYSDENSPAVSFHMQVDDGSIEELSSKDVGLRPGRRFSKDVLDRTFGLISAAGIISSILFAIGQQRLADETNKITKEAYAATQRAFVTVNELQVFGEPDTPPEVPIWWSFRAVAKNSGSTPTKNMIVKYNLLLIEKGQISPAFFDGLMPPTDPDALSSNQSKVRLGANSTVPIGINGTARSAENGNLAFPNGTAYDIESGYTKGYYLGSIYYNDIFENTPEHVTKFCFVIDVKTKRNLSYPKPANAGLCSFFNCSDDECKSDEAEFRKARRAALIQAKTDAPTAGELRWKKIRDDLKSIWGGPVSYFPLLEEPLLLLRRPRPRPKTISPMLPQLPELSLLQVED